MKDLDLTRLLQRVFVPVVAVILALIVGGVLVAVSGVSPTDALGTIVQAGFSCSPDYCNFASTLASSGPLIFTTLGAVVVLRAGLFSIGQEGQYGMGALAAVYVGTTLHLPIVIHPIVTLLAAAVAGALIGVIPAIFRAYFGANELIVSIILNSIAALFLGFMVNYPLRAAGATASYTAPVDVTTQLPVFDPTTKLGLNFVIAIVAVAAVWFFLNRSKWGYEQRMSGEAPTFARYSGMKTRTAVIRAAAIGGGLAGIGGGVQVIGMNYRVLDGFMDGTGLNGLTAAILGGTTVLGGALAAILFSGIMVGAVNGLQILMGIPRELGAMVPALIILFVSVQRPLLDRLELWTSKRRGFAAIARHDDQQGPPLPPTGSGLEAATADVVEAGDR